MATRPANAPLKAIVASHLPNIARAVTIAAMQPNAAAAFVLIVTLAINSGSADIVLPGLNPNQPSHRMNTPRATNTRLWPGIARVVSSSGVLANARAQHERADQRQPAAATVHHGRAGEVKEVH